MGTLEELHRPFMFLHGFTRGEGSQVLGACQPSIDLLGIQTLLAGLMFFGSCLRTCSSSVREDRLCCEKHSLAKLVTFVKHEGDQHGRKEHSGIWDIPDRAQSEDDRLVQNGFRAEDISVLMADNIGTKGFAHEKNTKAPEGTTTGAVAGGIVGGTL
jgi:hypothetical protein